MEESEVDLFHFCVAPVAQLNDDSSKKTSQEDR